MNLIFEKLLRYLKLATSSRWIRGTIRCWVSLRSWRVCCSS